MTSVTKRLLLLFSVCLLLGILGVGALSYSSYRRNEHSQGLLRASVALASTLAAMQHSDHPPSPFTATNAKYFEASVKFSLSSYHLSLLALDKARVNLTKLYQRSYSSVTQTYGGVENTPVVGYSPATATQTQASLPPNSSNIFYFQGDAYVYVSSLHFVNGQALETYKGVTIPLSENTVPQTYTLMLHNPDFIYHYSTYMVSSTSNPRYLAVVYTSVLTNKLLVIRVYNNGNRITGFEVRN